MWFFQRLKYPGWDKWYFDQTPSILQRYNETLRDFKNHNLINANQFSARGNPWLAPEAITISLADVEFVDIGHSFTHKMCNIWNSTHLNEIFWSVILVQWNCYSILGYCEDIRDYYVCKWVLSRIIINFYGKVIHNISNYLLNHANCWLFSKKWEMETWLGGLCTFINIYHFILIRMF